MSLSSSSKDSLRLTRIVTQLSSWALTAVAAALAVWSDILILEARWIIWPGVLVIIGGIIVAYGSLGFSLSQNLFQRKREIWFNVFWMLIPTIPALVTAISNDFTNPQIFARISVICGATGVGIGISRRFSVPVTTSTSKTYQIVCYLGQGLITLWLAIAALFYVSAPLLQVVFE